MNNRHQLKIFMKIILLFLITLVGFWNCKKKIGNYGSTEMHPQYNPASPQIIKIVMADGGLNARDVPALDGKVAFLIPKYLLLEPVEEVGEEIEIKDKKGKWAKIQFKDKIGYVFGGYLVKAIIEGHEQNSEGGYEYTFYSLPQSDNPEPSDCRSNYMQAGCLVVVYKSSNEEAVTAFSDTVATGWVDKNHLATSWSIGDAGYGGEGIKSLNIHTKAEIDIWKREIIDNIDLPEEGIKSDSLCLKKFCFDLKKNPDLIAQIKATKGLKYYATAVEYGAMIDTYSTEISIGENKSITFIPDKNVVIGH